MKDLLNNIDVKTVLAPVSISDTTARVGAVIDRHGFDSLTYVIALGAIADADATFVVLLEESDASDMAGAVAVDDAFLLGTEALAAFKFDSDNGCRKLGYIGGKRYTRMTITPVGNSGAALFGVLALLGHPVYAPTANPPA